MRMVEAAAGLIAYERGDLLIAINTTGRELPLARSGRPLLESERGALRGQELAPHGGVVMALG
jgi:hypothetical protein